MYLPHRAVEFDPTAMRIGALVWVCVLEVLPHSNADSSAPTTTSKNAPLTTWTAQSEFPRAIFDSYYKEPSSVQQVSRISNITSLRSWALTMCSHSQSYTMNFLIPPFPLILPTQHASRMLSPIH